MPVSLSVSVQGIDQLQKSLDRINPKKNSAWVRRALMNSAKLVQQITAQEMIIRGSRFRGPKGKRGGKGKMISAGTHPTKLTSRHGGAGIVGSIRVDHSPLPWAIEVGSDKIYAHVHEFGGTFKIGAYDRRIAQSARSGGASMAHVRAHTRTYPARSFFAPGLEKAARSFEDIFAREWEREMP